MITFKVDDMTCGHCVATITAAIKAHDSALQVTCDLTLHTVKIVAEPTECKPIEDCIRSAGYTPVAA